MLDFILDVIYLIIICYLNGYLIKKAITTFKCKTYVIFGAYCTLVFYNLVILMKYFLYQ